MKKEALSQEEKVDLIYGLFQVLKKNKQIKGEKETEKRLIEFVLEIQDKLDGNVSFD